MALRFLKLFGLLAAAIVATYFAPKVVSSIFFIAAIIAYFYDKDEAVWLTFFFVISDGFLGFFNNYEAVVSIIPGLPNVEIGHFYIVATLIKSRKVGGRPYPLFYRHIGIALLVYTLFLVAQGYAIGVTPEIRFHFRILKYVLPLTLFITLPRLIADKAAYHEVFELFIPFAFLATFAQLFTVASGIAPSQALGLRQDLWFTDVFEHGHTYRGFYSTGMVLISFFGAQFYLSMEPSSRKRQLYMAVIFADVLSAFMSATRGWVLGFALILILQAMFVARWNAGRIALGTVLGAALLFGILRIPAVERQVQDATDRILTIGLLAKGDVTAGGTLERLDRRSPRVMKKWEESPLTGWGFSDEYREYNDSHVGNQNVLLHAGIIGAALMAAFLVFFSVKLIARSTELPEGALYKRGLLVFPIFLLGWFIIHSSSGQWFEFGGEPGVTIPQVLFFSFGAFCYRDSFPPQE